MTYNHNCDVVDIVLCCMQMIPRALLIEFVGCWWIEEQDATQVPYSHCFPDCESAKDLRCPIVK